MATKSGLITAINNFITATVNITKHRNSMLELVNEIFQTTSTQTGTVGALGIALQYTVRYKKVGNIVYIDGEIKNTSAIYYNNIALLVIPNTLFYAKTGQPTKVRCFTDTVTDASIEFFLSNINLASPLAPNQTIFINAHYQTND